jgi:hypothetical protein
VPGTSGKDTFQRITAPGQGFTGTRTRDLLSR